MRLLSLNREGNLSLSDDLDDTPRYAILSHTWGADSDEVTFDDIQHSRARNKIGHVKVDFCVEQARKDGIEHVWIDTCCINKASHVELSEAITSMFRWYRNAIKCYVYLGDVSYRMGRVDRTDFVWIESFRRSRWFTRGWTLQELLAPIDVEFFSQEGVLLGSKISLLRHISEVTKIPREALNGTSLNHFSIEQRMYWAQHRRTKKPEDKVYCLLGILDVVLLPNYGEGEQNAFRRLRREIGVTPKQIDDVIRQTYNNGQLEVERLSGRLLPLEYCFVNLGIVQHVHDNTKSDQDAITERTSRFSLPKRLNVEIPPESHQVSLDRLFEPRKLKDGTTSQPKRIFIWGRAGMGKTTLCKKIVHQVINHSLWRNIYDRVIWLRLRRLKKIQVRDTIELLQYEYPLSGLGERLSESLRRLIQDERTLFLLDGLDEVSFVLDQDSPSGRILHDLLLRPHVIVTSRPHSTHIINRKPFDLELETVGFFPPQIEEYLQRVAREANMTNQMIKDIRSFIQSRPFIQSLARIPVQLDAICYSWSGKGLSQNHTTMTSLYSTITQSLWGETLLRLGRRNNGELVTKQQVQDWPYSESFVSCEVDFLQELAFQGMYNNVIEFSIKDMEKTRAFRRMLSDTPVHISFLRASDNSVEASDRTLHFVHLTFQEFFAAQFFVRRWTSGEPLLPLGRSEHENRLTESVEIITPTSFLRSEKFTEYYDIFWRFVVGLLQTGFDKKHLYQFFRILEEEPTDLIGRTYQRLNMHLLSEVDSNNSGFKCHAQKLEDRCLQWILYESRLKRGWLSQIKSRSLVWEAECSDYIMERLLATQDINEEVLHALCHRSSISPCLLDAIFGVLGRSRDKAVRSLALQIIGRFCDSDQKKFTEFWHSTKGTEDRILEAIKAWQEIQRLTSPAIEVLVSLSSHSNETVQTRAVKLLGKQTTFLAEALLSMLRQSDRSVQCGTDEALRIQAIDSPDARTSILQLADRSIRNGVSEIVVKQANLPVQDLIPMLEHPDRSLRHRAADSLGRQANLSVKDLFLMLQHSDRYVRYRAADALHRQENLSAKALMSLLQHQDEPVRYGAADALARQVALPVKALRSILQFPDQSIRTRIIRGFERQTTLPNMTVEGLVQLLQHPDASVRSEAAGLLRRQTYLSDAAIKSLISLPAGLGESILSEEVAKALGRQTNLPGTAVENLIVLLRNPSESTRNTVANTLRIQQNLSGTAVQALVLQLPHLNKSTRHDVVEALLTQAKLSDTVVPALLSMLEHPDQSVRFEAARLLGRRPNLSNEAVYALVPLLLDPEELVRQSVAEALKRQESIPGAAVSALLLLLQSSDLPLYREAIDTKASRKDLPLYREAIDTIASRKEILFTLPYLESKDLRNFLTFWFSTDSAICFIWEDCLCIRSSGGLLRIPVEEQQLKAFKFEWSRAQNYLGLPSLSPLLSALVVPDTMETA